MAIKVAFIGAGSVGFTRTLMRDILAVPELADTHFAFHDISARNLDMVRQICLKDIAENKLPAVTSATTDRRRALADADYVINCTRIGGLEAFQTDIDIPLKYGIDQCVGDTLCAGGIMYGQRNIPQILAFCKDVREVACQDAWLLNYANPMAMNTWAALDTGIQVLGLCHGVQGAHWQIADVIERWALKEGLIEKGYGTPHPRENPSGNFHKLHRSEVDVIAAGINHQTWFTKVQWRGLDLLPMLPELFEDHPVYSKTEKVRVDVLKRFGYYSTESNGHLSEYLPWYRKRPAEIRKWIDLSLWINGETGGYLRVCTEGRNWFQTDFPRWLKEAGTPITSERRSEEHGSYIIEALETGRTYRGHFNVRNHNAISNLPADCVVEVPGYVDRTGVHVPRVGELPLACAATCLSSINVQRMSVKAAVEGDATLLKQAMLHDPLVGAVCNPAEVWQMADEMLVAQAQWLPQYRANGSIAQAKKRLASGTRVKTKAWKGAARLKTKSVAQLRARREQSVLAADKAAAQRAKAAKDAKGA